MGLGVKYKQDKTKARSGAGLVGVELLALLGVVDEDGRRGKLLPELLAVLVHQIHKLLCAIGIDQAEGAAAERREANAKHGSNVCTGVRSGAVWRRARWTRASDGRGGDDLVLQAQGGLVDEAAHHAQLDVLDGHEL